MTEGQEDATFQIPPPSRYAGTLLYMWTLQVPHTQSPSPILKLGRAHPSCHALWSRLPSTVVCSMSWKAGYHQKSQKGSPSACNRLLWAPWHPEGAGPSPSTGRCNTVGERDNGSINSAVCCFITALSSSLIDILECMFLTDNQTPEQVLIGFSSDRGGSILAWQMSH